LSIRGGQYDKLVHDETDEAGYEVQIWHSIR